MPILRYVLYGLLFMTAAMARGGSLGYISEVRAIGSKSYSFDVTIAYGDESDSTPNPCYGSSSLTGCWYVFTVATQEKRRPGFYGLIGQGRSINAVNDRTIGGVVERYKTQSGVTFPYSFTISAGSWFSAYQYSLERTCFGLFRITGGGPSWQIGTPAPGSTCGIAPPPLGVCKLVGDIILDHGTVNSDKINGNQATTTANLECSQAMSIKVTATGVATTDVVLRADGSLSASLQVNGVAGKTGANVDVPANTRTPVKFTSVLKTKGAVAAGPFSGSGTAVLSIP
jgi:hypothetical protein